MPREPIILYYWPTPNGWKVSIALEEMALPYETRFINILKGEQFEPSFLAISPNNRIPAITDPDGPDGAPLSLFESGAILQYLGRKTGLYYPQDPRAQAEVEQWLFWQVGGFGPMLGQAHHFRQYAQEKIDYAIERYTNEAHRLYGVLERALADREYLGGAYSIADMAVYGWAAAHENQGVDLREFSHVRGWFERVGGREAVRRGLALGKEKRAKTLAASSEEGAAARQILFGQRARRP